MFRSLKTSKSNKEIISNLTRKFNLGSENIIARIAIAYSLSKGKKFTLDDIADSQGKEYSKNVLLGKYDYIYYAMICNFYNLNRNDKDISRYIKLHLDNGIELINNEQDEYKNTTGFEYITKKINYGVNNIK